jgi:adenylate kinase family enzyme
MQCIAVIGNGGGGKSRLCRQLGERWHLPVYSFDSIQWKPGWVPAPIDEQRAAHDQWLRSDAWIIDGWGSWEMLEERFNRADRIIFVDFPLWRHYWWATKRMIASVFHPLPEEPEGCSYARVPWRMYQTLWRVHRRLRPRLIALLARYAQDRVVYIRTLPELRAILDSPFRELSLRSA